MNANSQAQKSFKSFILVISVSLILFSAVYFVVSKNSQNKEITENKGVVTNQEETNTLRDYSKGKAEEANKKTQEESPTMKIENVAEDEFSGDDVYVMLDSGSEPVEQAVSESAFGGLIGQKPDIPGQVAEPSDSGEEVKGAATTEDTAVQQPQQPEQASKPEVKGVSEYSAESKTAPAANLVSASSTVPVETKIGDEEEVVAYIEDNIANVVDEKTGSSKTEVLGDNDALSAGTVPSKTANLPSGLKPDNSPDPQVGGVQNTQPFLSSSSPQVLAGADETAEVPVPDTGIASMTIGLVVSFAVFLFAVVWIVKGPRKMAINGFEKDLTRENIN